MDSRKKHLYDNTSTPKRRRLGTGRILKPSLRLNIKENKDFPLQCSPIHSPISATIKISGEICESPPLPSNQDKFLHDSRNNSSVCYIPSSPAILNDSASSNDHWESLSNSDVRDLCHSDISTQEVINEIKDISNDMFQSRLEHDSNILSQSKSDQNNIKRPEKQNISAGGHSIETNKKCFTETTSLNLKSVPEIFDKPHGFEDNFKEDVDESFQLVNQSICGIEDDKSNKAHNKSSLFETKDSFLLDIQESGIVPESQKFAKPLTPATHYDNSFYGLPSLTRDLFKTYRNIEKFYDWQEECLNLDAIKKRRNLIYALPTSGGKTLVAEVLMMREVINRKKNALFILPFVAIVQEKIWSLSPFALKLNFLVEEYAGGKGHMPPIKRRKKNSIYIATIEKGLGLLRSLIELKRLDEIGLIVVDELHLIGEQTRGGTLEMLLTTAMYVNKDIQIVGMSATIGNLPELARFLNADVFERHFRPVELTEYVKLGDVLHKLVWGAGGLEIVPDRQLAYDYSSVASSLDPDWLGGLVSEVVPGGSCLVFCPTKRNCENVAALLCKLQRREMMSHRTSERQVLERALRAEGARELAQLVRSGVAYHHAGLSSEERSLLEQAFRAGAVSALCCTSTLAAGVNLPARRVIVRAPRVGRDLLTLAGYRQMAGRAGRAGVCEAGESIIMCNPCEWERVRGVLGGGLAAACSRLRPQVGAFLLAAAALGLATTRPALGALLGRTLLAASPDVDMKRVCDESIQSLIQSGALEVDNSRVKKMQPAEDEGSCYVYDDSTLVASKLGVAAVQGGMDLESAKQFLEDIKVASRGLVLIDSLHLLYIVTPHDAAGVKPDYRHYYSLYGTLDEEGIQTAKVLGITEMNAIRMMTGKSITNVPERVLCRFYLALMLRDLWRQMPFPAVADKYGVSRGVVQAALGAACAQAASGRRLCGALPQPPALRWLAALLAELAARLLHCAAPDLADLMRLPHVRKARAMQLMRAGYKRIEDVAKASVEELVTSVEHLPRTAATHLVSAARMILIEKVENLRAEAEDVMEDLAGP